MEVQLDAKVNIQAVNKQCSFDLSATFWDNYRRKTTLERIEI